MNENVLFNLKENLLKKYKLLNDGWTKIEIYDGIITIIWDPAIDQYITKRINTTLRNIAKYMYNFLKKHKQKGYFYIGGYVYEVMLNE